MSDIVFPAPFAWDALKKEYIYCTDGVAEWPIIDVWYYEEFLGHYAADDDMCQYSCCEEPYYYQGELINDEYYGGYWFCHPQTTSETTPDGRSVCCPPRPCSYAPVTRVTGQFDVYLASDAKDKWHKIATGVQINRQSKEYTKASAVNWSQDEKAFDNTSKLLTSFNLSTSSTADIRDSFMGMGCNQISSIYGCEFLPGATGESSFPEESATIFVSQSMMEDQLEREYRNDITPAAYGLYFLAVGDIVHVAPDLCGGGEDSTFVLPPVIHAGIREKRQAEDNYRRCRKQTPDADCNSYNVKTPGLPVLLGASGPSLWHTPAKFRERALFSAAWEDCVFLTAAVGRSENTSFTNPWTGELEDAGSYQFKLYGQAD